VDQDMTSNRRIVLGAIAGFFAWATAWFGCEAVLSTTWAWYGLHQGAFQAAVVDGGSFTANSSLLLIHIVLGSIISVMSGFVAALIARENRRAPLVLGLLLLGVGVLKAVLSWPYVPIWYHITFTAMLVPMALVGGRLRAIS
jgi:hypothetical protein